MGRVYLHFSSPKLLAYESVGVEKGEEVGSHGQKWQREFLEGTGDDPELLDLGYEV